MIRALKTLEKIHVTENAWGMGLATLIYLGKLGKGKNLSRRP